MYDVVEVLAKERVLPVVVIDDADKAQRLGEAIVAGGLHTIEVTFRTAAAPAAVARLAANPDLLVGAGTVLSPDQVDAAVEAGARFVVSPGFSEAVVRRCRQRGVPVFPGVATATEIQAAIEAGLETVKFFPAAQLGGTTMIKALAAPFRSVRFVPTGGVNSANLAEYLAVPSVLAVGGTWLCTPAVQREDAWDRVTADVAAAVAVVGAVTEG